jgi:predicted dehydrogenase
MARLESVAAGGRAAVAAICDPDGERRARARDVAPGAVERGSLEAVLDLPDLDGVVLATPNDLHAWQAVAALRRGLAVFCQKPLGRDAAETERVVAAAAEAGRPLGVDLCYREVAAVRAARRALRAGRAGRPFAADLVFHNAYGPQSQWFGRRSSAGGGCLLDLGTHLLDLAHHLLGGGAVDLRSAVTLRAGAPVGTGGDEVEDYATAELALAGCEVRLAASWNLPIGRGCRFEATVYGDRGAVSIGNVGGSFYDFRSELWNGDTSELLCVPGDDWGGRALAAWAADLAGGAGYRASEGARLVQLAGTLDRIYEAAACGS